MQQNTQSNNGFIKIHKGNRQARHDSVEASASGCPAIAYRPNEQRGKQWKREDKRDYYLN